MLNNKENGSSIIDKYSLNYCYDNNKGVFITIKNDEDELKGCLGTFTLHNKIAYYIAYYTIKSLLQDTRFHPNGLIKKNEVKDLECSINFIGQETLIYPDQSITIDPKYFTINQLVFESFKKYYKLRIHGVKIYYEENKSSTYLASVVFDNLRIKNIENLTQNKIDSLLEELRIKANTNKNIIQITIYECEEYSIIDEQLKQNLMSIKT
jgi:AMMECR1 domain-containing protein